jgi:hypothetical protein
MRVRERARVFVRACRWSGVETHRVQLKQAPSACEVSWLSPRLQHGQNQSNLLHAGAKLRRQILWCKRPGHAVLVEAQSADPDRRSLGIAFDFVAPTLQCGTNRQDGIRPRIWKSRVRASEDRCQQKTFILSRQQRCSEHTKEHAKRDNPIETATREGRLERA